MHSAEQLKSLKGQRKLSLLTCYDYQMARWMNRTQLDAVLVGDSLAQVIYGMEHTAEVSMDTMLAHVKAVRKGLEIHLIADMPYSSYLDPESALRNALRFKGIGADSVKLENPSSEIVEKILSENIPVCGHVGLTPQTIYDFKKQGKDSESAKQIIVDAKRLDQMGCYGIILEAIPNQLAKAITETVSSLTIGIASGKECDAQILVHYDLLGITYEAKKFVKPVENFGEKMLNAIEGYIETIK